MSEKAEIVTVGDLKKALSSFPDDAYILVLHPYMHTTKNGKAVPVGDLFDISSLDNKNNGFAIFMLNQKTLEESSSDPEDILTEEDLEKMED